MSGPPPEAMSVGQSHIVMLWPRQCRGAVGTSTRRGINAPFQRQRGWCALQRLRYPTLIMIAGRQAAGQHERAAFRLLLPVGHNVARGVCVRFCCLRLSCAWKHVTNWSRGVRRVSGAEYDLICRVQTKNDQEAGWRASSEAHGVIGTSVGSAPPGAALCPLGDACT
jgi:hypothetical protein